MIFELPDEGSVEMTTPPAGGKHARRDVRALSHLLRLHGALGPIEERLTHIGSVVRVQRRDAERLRQRSADARARAERVRQLARQAASVASSERPREPTTDNPCNCECERTSRK